MKKYPHISELSLPELPAKSVELFIGADVQAAHRPQELRVGEDEEPMAVFTGVGWTHVGSPEP